MKKSFILIMGLVLLISCAGGQEEADNASVLRIKSGLESNLNIRFSGGKAVFDNAVSGSEQQSFLILGSAAGTDFASVDEIMKRVNGWFEENQWTADPAFAADGPTGTGFAWRRSGALAVISIEIAESTLESLPADQPLDISSIPAEQLGYTIRIHIIPNVAIAEAKAAAPEITFKAYLIPILISNAIAVLLIVLCAAFPKAGRIAWIVIFLAAGIFNIYSAITAPQAYLMYEKTALLPVYKDFISGPFSRNITLYVTLIGAGQIVTALLLIMRKPLFFLGILGGIVFLLAIVPLGIGSAFPCTLLMIISLLVLQARHGPPKPR
jgi:hypothetical protein